MPGMDPGVRIPDNPACVTGWEFLGQREAADAGRRFEVISSVDPRVVSTAAAICARLARPARARAACRGTRHARPEIMGPNGTGHGSRLRRREPNAVIAPA